MIWPVLLFVVCRSRMLEMGQSTPGFDWFAIKGDCVGWFCLGYINCAQAGTSVREVWRLGSVTCKKGNATTGLYRPCCLAGGKTFSPAHLNGIQGQNSPISMSPFLSKLSFHLQGRLLIQCLNQLAFPVLISAPFSFSFPRNEFLILYSTVN